ncbi:hypothetical protein [Brevibacterium casei]|uniref:hypothetical protein n=1 Tax=Brevibacterium casei TaxID=33889 RepID=UPI00223B0ADC|nr:hypothetical protein [Brevibacterium casei]MCT1551788.1 hypothetical protein [Brevibacterium casei]MCT1561358.1 hypothetical protein [Brevibacterium casei]MCT2209552.1 hypothetical protein [Brevibacterium casei]
MIDTDFSNLVTRRAHALDVLICCVRSIANADDYGDMLGALRLAELAAQQVRIAIIREARAAGDEWEDIAYALGCSAQDARTRFE